MKEILIMSAEVTILFACSKPEPPQPPVVKVRPAVAIKAATGVEITKATLVAKVMPNENGTTVSFEYKTQASSTWTTISVSGTLSGKEFFGFILKKLVCSINCQVYNLLIA